MGIFKTIMSGLGFKQEEEINSTNFEESGEEVSPISMTSSVDVNKQNSEKQVSVNNLVCYAPKSNGDIKLLVDCLKNSEACIINLGGLTEQDIKSVLDYLGGAVYALGGAISRLQGNLYVLSPKDVKITTV